MSIRAPSDFARYRVTLRRTIRAWHMLAAHVWLRLSAVARRNHNVILPERFCSDSDIPRTFALACAAFQEALRDLTEFTEVDAEFPWLWCGGQTVTLSGPRPEVDLWLDSMRSLGPNELQHEIDAFVERARRASTQFQALSERFERAQEEAIAAAENRVEARLQIAHAIQAAQEDAKRTEEQHSRRKRLPRLLSVAISALGEIESPQWSQRVAETLIRVGEEVREQQWEEWFDASTEDGSLIGDLAELILRGDEARIVAAVEVLPRLRADLKSVQDWLGTLNRDWPKVFDEGWLRWMLNRSLPPTSQVSPEASHVAGASSAQDAQVVPAAVTPGPVRDLVFVSYSHKDKRWLDDLQTHLRPYVRDDSITVWSDEQIKPGSKWLSEIRAALACTQVAVLLVTPNFLASDFIHEHELSPLLKAAQEGGATLLWIPVRASSYDKSPIAELQAVSEPSTPLASMKKADRDAAWVRICKEIERATNASRR